jgi:peptide/nickel transport system permease protein
MAADDALPDVDRLLPGQSRAEPEEAGDQPDRDARHGQEQLESWLQFATATAQLFVRYGQWLGVWPKQPGDRPGDGQSQPRFAFCDEPSEPIYSGILQGDFGCSTKFRTTVAQKLFPALKATGILMFWVMVTMVPSRC